MSSTDLAHLFECPVCYHAVLPPIYQCPEGHLVCADCRPKLSGTCPECRAELGKIRNLALEKVAKSVAFPCINAESGCTTVTRYDQKERHEKECEFRLLSCPHPGERCVWLGPVKELIAHLHGTHRIPPAIVGADILFLATNLQVTGTVYWTLIQSCFEHQFVVIMEKKDTPDGGAQYLAFMVILGSQKEAANFICNLELVENRRRFTWSAIPRPIEDGIAGALQDRDGLIFDDTIAKRAAHNHCLDLEVTVQWVGVETPSKSPPLNRATATVPASNPSFIDLTGPEDDNPGEPGENSTRQRSPLRPPIPLSPEPQDEEVLVIDLSPEMEEAYTPPGTPPPPLTFRSEAQNRPSEPRPSSNDRTEAVVMAPREPGSLPRPSTSRLRARSHTPEPRPSSNRRTTGSVIEPRASGARPRPSAFRLESRNRSPEPQNNATVRSEVVVVGPRARSPHHEPTNSGAQRNIYCWRCHQAGHPVQQCDREKQKKPRHRKRNRGNRRGRQNPQGMPL